MTDIQPASSPRVKTGLASLCAASFKQIGANEPDSRFAATLRQDYSRVVKFLNGCFDEVVAPGILSTAGDVGPAVAQFERERVDAVILLHIRFTSRGRSPMRSWPPAKRICRSAWATTP